jgi:uncharacterized membrane-anchored protein
MRKFMTHALLAAIALLFAVPALADGPGSAGPDKAAAPVIRAGPIPAPAAAAAPVGRSGAIALLDGEISLNVPAGYSFYSAEEAYAYLQRTGAAAPSGTIVGLIGRANVNVRAPGTWATVVSYDAIGYVAPETASGLADANFEADVRTARASQSRVFEGFAAQPAFDAVTPNVVWAERAAAPGSAGSDLRYEQKSLGRKGVACLSSIGSADQMDEIAAAAAGMQSMLSFGEGSRHADFQPASDQVSAYSVPGLVTGIAAGEVEPAAPAQTQTGIGGLSGWFPWIAFGVVGLAIVGYMMTRRRTAPDTDAEDDEAAPPARPAAVVAPPPPPPPPPAEAPPAAEEPKPE